MGLYDSINGEQIKCFYTPIFSTPEGIWYSGGHMIDFIDGDEVPTKSMYYKYPDNFIILDHDTYNTGCCIHIIKDKKVFKTCTLTDISNDYFKDNTLVINRHGTSILNISSVEDLKLYIKDTNTLFNTIHDLETETRNSFDKFLKCFRLIQKFEAMKQDDKILDLIDNDNFYLVEPFFKNRNINTFKELKDKKKELLLNNELLEDLTLFFKETLNKEFKKLNKEHDDKDSKSKELIKPYKEKHSQKWFLKDEFILEKEFGEYLECITYLFYEKGKNYAGIDNMERYLSCKEAFDTFIKNNPEIKDKYIAWAELDNKDINSLNDTLNQVLYC